MAPVYRVRAPSRWRARLPPSTRAGRLACWLALGFLTWFALWILLAIVTSDVRGLFPFAVFVAISLAGLGLGVAAGTLALFGILRRGERSALVFAALLPAAFATALLVYELFIPHG